MAAKPKLWYFRGRGRMESIRWLLAAAGVETDTCFSARCLWLKATKYNLHGKDQKETVRIDMYAKGTLDLMMMVVVAAFKPLEEKEESLVSVVKKAKTQHLPVFEKILKDHGEDFLVGNKFSWADIQLLEAILMVEELDASVLSDVPLLKEFKTRTSNIPTIKKFLQPGSQRKLPPDSHYVKVVRSVLQF